MALVIDRKTTIIGKLSRSLDPRTIDYYKLACRMVLTRNVDDSSFFDIYKHVENELGEKESVRFTCGVLKETGYNNHRLIEFAEKEMGYDMSGLDLRKDYARADLILTTYDFTEDLFQADNRNDFQDFQSCVCSKAGVDLNGYDSPFKLVKLCFDEGIIDNNDCSQMYQWARAFNRDDIFDGYRRRHLVTHDGTTTEVTNTDSNGVQSTTGMSSRDSSDVQSIPGMSSTDSNGVQSTTGMSSRDSTDVQSTTGMSSRDSNDVQSTTGMSSRDSNDVQSTTGMTDNGTATTTGNGRHSTIVVTDGSIDRHTGTVETNNDSTTSGVSAVTIKVDNSSTEVTINVVTNGTNGIIATTTPCMTNSGTDTGVTGSVVDITEGVPYFSQPTQVDRDGGSQLVTECANPDINDVLNKEPDTNDILSICQPYTGTINTDELAQQLCLNRNERIEIQNPLIGNPLEEAVEKWKQRQPSPVTWMTFRTALINMNRIDLAQEVNKFLRNHFDEYSDSLSYF